MKPTSSACPLAPRTLRVSLIVSYLTTTCWAQAAQAEHLSPVSQPRGAPTLVLAVNNTAEGKTERLSSDRLRSAAARDSTSADRPITREELFRAIQRRARRELKRRRARRWSLNGFASWTGGLESNPTLSKRHKSAFFMEEYLNATFSYRLLPQLTWQASYSLDAFNYDRFHNLSTFTNSLTTKLLYRLAKPITVEAHYVYEDINYPNDRSSSAWNQRVHLRLRQTFFKQYYHYAGWTYLFKQYEDRRIRNGAGTRIPGKYRKDRRHTVTYELGGRVGEKLDLRIRQDVAFNDSNDPFQDFYDAKDYKVKLSGTYDWTKQWASSGGFTYELKRYEERVITATRPVKQRDYTKTYEIGLTYRFKPSVGLTYSWKYVRNTSNDRAQSYGDVTNSLTLNTLF